VTKLYQTKEEKPRFGVLLAFNSDGLAVLEMRPSKEILTFPTKDVEEVRPYTVSVRFPSNTTNYHYFAKRGSLVKGDLVLTKDGQIVVVTAADTKSGRATKHLSGRKLVTEVLEVSDEIDMLASIENDEDEL